MNTLRAAGLLGLTAWTFASGCVTVPPPAREPQETALEQQDQDEEQQPEMSAEWLFVTAQGAHTSSKDAECIKVKRWVRGEAKCATEMCVSGRNLAKEWLQRCNKVVPNDADKVQELVDNLDERVHADGNDCSHRGVALLRADDCGTPDQCETKAQTWIATCGPRYATPLVLLMLTKTLQRQFPDDPNKPRHIVKFDTRSCEQLGKQIGEGVGCDGPKACQTAVDARSAWMTRCYDKKIKLPAKLAFEMADVLVGAGQGVDPMEVTPTERDAPQGLLHLPLEEGKGGVVWACGVRPSSVSGYLTTRKGCRPGEVIVLHLDKSNNLRAISVPHPNDATFSRLFPFLRVKGEDAARAKAHQASFRAAMAETVELASGRHPERAIPTFTRAVLSNLWRIAKNKQFKQILRDSDLALTSMFRAWGKKKVKKLYRIRSEGDKVMFVGRAKHSPLDDMAPDGTIKPGTFAAPWSVDLRTLMPSSFAAYADEIDRLRMFSKLHHLKSSQLDRIREHVYREIRSCSQHEKQIETALEKTERCMFEETGCTQAKMKALSASAAPARMAAQGARTSIQIMLASGVLGQAETERLESQRVASGCLDP